MKKKIILTLFILTVALVAIASYFSYINKGIIYHIVTNDISSIVEDIQSLGSWAAVVLFILVVVEVIAAPIPPLILYVAAGLVLGGFFGGVVILTGNIVGAIIAFMLARTICKNYIKKKIGIKNSQRFGRITEKYGPFGIFILRINPLTSTDLISYLAGLSRMRLSRFVIATTLGLAPLVFSQTYLGSDIIKENSFLLALFVWVGIAYLLFILYVLFRLMKKRKLNNRVQLKKSNKRP